ncbi:MAG: Crp/Fnr family transcriptional regulator [Intrasporangium sp.]|uniref:Crp/Fnr family transcriptional regulator n=1 Tax=Intrasporangium sp. TaxID=1925024 RepID=UPI002649978D|nr:Crp/Fnr family transcriptional regulator [Intrasporangium sp.]MDN5797906.1 Crp/Fnr family transcriptional regulator [Intrasporangium sp.]
MDFDLLAPLDPAKQREVLSLTTAHRYRAGEVLFNEGDLGNTLHLLAAGRVRVQLATPDGEVMALTVMGPGSAFGEQALVDTTARRTATVVAIDQVETRTLHRGEFERLRAREPAVDRMLVVALAGQVRRLSRQLAEMSYLPAPTRVLRRMLELGALFDGGQVPVTQSEIASMAGTTRVTVNRVLHTLAEDQLVWLGRGWFAVLDPAGLAQRAR